MLRKARENKKVDYFTRKAALVFFRASAFSALGFSPINANMKDLTLSIPQAEQIRPKATRVKPKRNDY